MPPAAMTGTSTASTTCGTKGSVAISPMCPPLSMPSAMMASTPVRANRLAKATEATTGITLEPMAFNAGMYSPGLPAPVVTTGTLSSTTTCMTSLTKGDMSMILTPKGLSVAAFVF